MKDKHLRAHIDTCIIYSRLSECPRRKFGALLIDPIRNTIIANGYNGGPRGGSDLCGRSFCFRDGLKREYFEYRRVSSQRPILGVSGPHDRVEILINSTLVHEIECCEVSAPFETAEAWIQMMILKYPGVRSGTHMELGCHHAEMNLICNCAAGGLKTSGAWLIVTGEPCLMCAKMIHHAGIEKVFLVSGGYSGDNGLDYLSIHRVPVQLVEGPQDPRDRIE